MDDNRHKKIDIKSKIINLLLILSLLIVLLSGIIISSSLFPFFNVANCDIFVTIHYISSYIMVIIFLIHLLLHLNLLALYIVKIFKLNNKKMIKNGIVIVTVTILLIIIKVNFLKGKNLQDSSGNQSEANEN